jgi:hypothetical protein
VRVPDEQEVVVSKFALVVFPDEVNAYQGFHALQALRRTRSVTVHGAAVVQRDNDGRLCIRKRSDEVPLGVGALVGSLQTEFLGAVERELAPGAFAVIAEISEDTSLDARMEELGGRVFYEWWEDFIDDLLEERTSVRRAELAARRAERQLRRRREPRRS